MLLACCFSLLIVYNLFTPRFCVCFGSLAACFGYCACLRLIVLLLYCVAVLCFLCLILGVCTFVCLILMFASVCFSLVWLFANDYVACYLNLVSCLFNSVVIVAM